MPNPKVRVDIPANASDRLNLAGRIYARHTSDGASSLLNSLQSHKWETNGPEVTNALSLHQQAEEFQRQANLAYRKRDLLLDEITESVKSSRDLLLGVFHDNPKELSQWGFDVSDSAKAAAKKI